MRAALFLLLGLLLVSCQTHERLGQTSTLEWDGRVGAISFDEMVQSYGTPDHVHVMDDGRKVGVWNQSRLVKEQGVTRFDTTNPANVQPVTPSEVRFEKQQWRMIFSANGMLEHYEVLRR